MCSQPRTIHALLQEKTLLTVPPHEFVCSIAFKMLANRTSAAAVMCEKNNFIGIITEHDIVGKAIALKHPSDKTTAAEIMTRNPVTVSADSGAGEALSILTRNGFRTLPVLDGQTLVGILDIRDLYRYMHCRLLKQIEADKNVIAYAFGEPYALCHHQDLFAA